MMQAERDGDTGLGSDHRSSTATPRWVKVFGITFVALLLLFIGLHLIGGSFPGHGFGERGDHALHSSAAELGHQQP
jgi:hypothetical protein